jgi:hypothetical protein
VADFKSGQIAQVMAGQHATAFASGRNGLSLGGSGALAPIEQGRPRAPSVERVPVPRGGFTAMRQAANGQSLLPSRHANVQPTKHGVTRISSPIGEIRLNVHRVTHGLARDRSTTHGGTRNAANKDTIWGSSGSGNDAAPANSGQGNSSNVAVSGPNSTSGAAAASGVSATVAAVSGGGNGNNGNGNGSGNNNGNGNNGNGNNGNNGNGNNGNGNANGNGHGHAYGRYKNR